MSSNTTEQPTTTAFPPPSSNGDINRLAATVSIGVVVLIMIIVSVVYVLYKKKKREASRNRTGGYQPHWQENTPPYSEPPFVHFEQNHLPPPQSNPSFARPYRPSRQPTGASRSPRSPSPELHRRRTRPRSPPPPAGTGLVVFTRRELERATYGFSKDNFLGRGGFGDVHEGILPNGQKIAVKQLKAGSSQGEREFQAEVEIISRVHHKHLVSLVGYCISKTQRMLVYDFVPNKTLEFHLHGQGRPVMKWPVRLRIALGAARGLAYLHEDCRPKVIHRDIKAANILLDNNFEAMVADFGLAKIIPDFNTHVSTLAKGTPGYWPPEYFDTNQVTEKADVFSFGVVLLELITGRRPLGADIGGNLVQWARPLLRTALKDGKFDTLVDQRLQKYYNYDEMACMVACAAASVRDAFKSRPPMSQVLRALEGTLPLPALNDGTEPRDSNVYNSHGSSDYKSANSTLGLDNTTNDI